jgi:hypothetical protein
MRYLLAAIFFSPCRLRAAMEHEGFAVAPNTVQRDRAAGSSMSAVR